jgi:hypothetical protein
MKDLLDDLARLTPLSPVDQRDIPPGACRVELAPWMSQSVEGGAMGRTRVRFAIWQLMIAISIIGLPLARIAEQERQRKASEYFNLLANYHESRTVASVACSPTRRCEFIDHRGRIMTSAEVRASRWHEQLAAKYRQAVAHPGLSVEPDPPRP